MDTQIAQQMPSIQMSNSTTNNVKISKIHLSAVAMSALLASQAALTFTLADIANNERERE